MPRTLPSLTVARRLAGVALGLAAAGAALAADDLPSNQDYLRYCASCHGVEGRGDGPVALSLKVLPADLTQLARQNGGSFPYARVRAVIDGRGVLGPHGPAEMPVWGERFRQEGQGQLEVRGRVLGIVDYLSAIQEP